MDKHKSHMHFTLYKRKNWTAMIWFREAVPQYKRDQATVSQTSLLCNNKA